MMAGDETSGAVGGAAQGATTGAAFGPWGAVIGGVVGGVAGFVSGKKSKKRAEEARRQHMALLQGIKTKYDAMLQDLDASSRERIDRSVEAYVQIEAVLDQALADGKQDVAAQFDAMRSLLDTNLQAELAAVGGNYAELRGMMDETAGTMRDYLEADIEAQDELRKAYDVNTKDVIPAIDKAMKVTETRVAEIQKAGGLTPEAGAVLSRAQEGLKQARVRFDQSEALVQSGGGASRKAGFDIEAVKALAGVNADLRQSGMQEMLSLSDRTAQLAQQKMGVAGQRQANLQDDSNARRLALESGIASKNEQLVGGRQAAELGATTRVAGQMENLLQQRGATDLAMEQDYYANRGQVMEKKMQSTNLLAGEQASNRASVAEKKIGVDMSIAGVLQGAAQRNEANAASSFAQVGQAVKNVASLDWSKFGSIPNPMGAGGPMKENTRGIESLRAAGFGK